MRLQFSAAENEAVDARHIKHVGQSSAEGRIAAVFGAQANMRERDDLAELRERFLADGSEQGEIVGMNEVLGRFADERRRGGAERSVD